MSEYAKFDRFCQIVLVKSGNMTTSRIPHFYNLPLDQRMQKIAEASGVNLEDLDGFNVPNLETDQADHMVENAIGAFGSRIGPVFGVRRGV